jgi:hypothetical protein
VECCPGCWNGVFSFLFFSFSFSFCGLSYHLGHATLCREDKRLLNYFRYFFRDFFLFKKNIYIMTQLMIMFSMYDCIFLFFSILQDVWFIFVGLLCTGSRYFLVKVF